MADMFMEEPLTPYTCRKLLEEGIKKIDYQKVIRSIVDMSEKDFAGISGISPRSLSRLKSEQKIPSHTAEVALSVLRIHQKAQEIFPDNGQAVQWMKQPNAALQGRTPVESAQNRFGAEEVLDILTRMEYGVYS